VAPSVENDEEQKFHNAIPCTMPQSLADAHCSSAVQLLLLHMHLGAITGQPGNGIIVCRM